MFKIRLFSKPKMLAVVLTSQSAFIENAPGNGQRGGLRSKPGQGLELLLPSPQNTASYRDWAEFPAVTYLPQRDALKDLGLNPESS